MSDIKSLRSELTEYCRRLYLREIVGGTQGNASVRVDNSRILITPAGKNLGYLEASDLVVISMKGEKKTGELEPSSEHNLHTGIYISRPDINAIIHAHPTAATACSIADMDMNKPVLPEIIITFGKIASVGYAKPGTTEVLARMKPVLGDHTAFLLKSHGAVTIGRDLEEAFNKMEMLERYARVMLAARQAGGLKQIPLTEARRLPGFSG